MDRSTSRDCYNGGYRPSKSFPLETVDEDVEQSLLSSSTLSGGGVSLTSPLKLFQSSDRGAPVSYGAIPAQNIVWVESGIELTSPDSTGSLSTSGSSGNLPRDNTYTTPNGAKLGHSSTSQSGSFQQLSSAKMGHSDSFGSLGSASAGAGGTVAVSGSASGKYPQGTASSKQRANVDSTFSAPMGTYFTELKDSSGGGSIKSNQSRSFSPMRNPQAVPAMYFQINRSDTEDYYDSAYMRSQNPLTRFFSRWWNKGWGGTGYGSHTVLTPEGFVSRESSGCSSLMEYISAEVAVILLLYIVNKAGQEMVWIDICYVRSVLTKLISVSFRPCRPFRP